MQVVKETKLEENILEANKEAALKKKTPKKTKDVGNALLYFKNSRKIIMMNFYQLSLSEARNVDNSQLGV